MKNKKCSKLIKKVTAMMLASVMAISMAGCGGNVSSDQDNTVINNETEISEDNQNIFDEEELLESKINTHEYEYSVFEKFLTLDPDQELAAVVDNGVALGADDFQKAYTGQYFTYRELIETMQATRYWNGTEDVDVTFAYLNIFGQEGLALKYDNMNIDGEGDDSFTILFVVYHDGELHICHSVSAWSRNEVTVNKNGFIYENGSGGAGARYIEYGLISSEGKYENIYSLANVYSSWIAYDTDNDAYDAAYGVTEEPNISVSVYTIDDKKYFEYELLDDAKLSQNDQIFIDELTAKDFQLISEEERGDIISSRMFELGVYISEAEVVSTGWNTIVNSEYGNYVRLAMNEMAECAFWNNYPVISTEEEFTPSERDMLVPFGSEASTIEELSGYSYYDYVEDIELYYVNSCKINDNEEFQIYVTNNSNTVISTPDRKKLTIFSSPVDFIYGTLPELKAADFDNDGENELMIWEYIFHGTGYSQQTLFIIDKNTENGEWTIYHLTPSWYLQELSKHYEAIDEENIISIFFDGVEYQIVDKSGDLSNIDLYCDNCVSISENDCNFDVELMPTFISELNPMGYFGNNVKMKIAYLGNGEWELIECVLE